MSKITTVLFDYDGTLMDTNDIIIQSWQHVFRTLTGAESDVKQILASFGEPLRETMRRFFPDSDLEACVELYRSYQVSFYQEKVRMFPGTEALIRNLKERGIKLAVVTSRLRPTTIEGLEKYGLSERFDCIVTADDTQKHKPDPEPVLIALQRLKRPPQEALMVGDSMFDMRCGQGAGVGTVLVNWAMAAQTQQEISGFSADYCIDRPEALLEIIDRSC